MCATKPVSVESEDGMKRNVILLCLTRRKTKGKFGAERRGAPLKSLCAASIIRDCPKIYVFLTEPRW